MTKPHTIMDELAEANDAMLDKARDDIKALFAEIVTSSTRTYIVDGNPLKACPVQVLLDKLKEL